MSTSKKVILGLFTILPLILLMVYFIFFFMFFINIASHEMHKDILPEEFPLFLQSFIPMMILMFMAVSSGFILMIYYIILISKNRSFDSTQRIIWVLIVVFTSTIGQIAYFIVEVWPDKPDSRPLVN
ncbi:PLDc N-terminal domain-containing protein [Fulvivirga sp. 29W222]|uniref:PLDc N-terminal domain-containing protein n=1 Tax=Fulvivirga marina TaxID=2494733 RepID=A0A937FXS0_9BACT|nr:PLDc N-terminal domain-containing protein [Fulvivirga marina]MBL6446953.1 PLDc N-terminal domain-containing protein [Fulvivirga marina]